MPYPKTGATHYYEQLGLSEKAHANKGLIVCFIVWLGSMKGMGRKTCARCVGLHLCGGQNGYRAQVLQHPIET